MPTANNDAQVVAMLLPALKEAAEYTADQILALNEEKIQIWVYNRYQPTSYKRSTEDSFKDAWKTEVTQGASNVTAKMDYAPEKMGIGHSYQDDGEPLFTNDAPYGRGRHVSALDRFDARVYLAEIIYEGKAGELFGTGAWTRSRNAFKQLDKTLGHNRLAEFFEKGMKMAGLKYKRNNRNFSKVVT